jgi:hypothetical protein
MIIFSEIMCLVVHPIFQPSQGAYKLALIKKKLRIMSLIMSNIKGSMLAGLYYFLVLAMNWSIIWH